MRKICIYTSTRAEYGILRNLVDGLLRHPNVRLQLLVSGTHLVAEYGLTVREIEADGHRIDEKVEMLLASDSQSGICKSMGLALIGYSDALVRLQPDILVILGDRFEAFCCATAAHVCRIPIAHIHGGERTEGVIDDAFRHAMTKMAFLHFPCCEEYRHRIIQLGESPDRVFNVGALGAENVQNTRLLSLAELTRSVENWPCYKKYFLVTFHPVTLGKTSNDSMRQMKALLAALDSYTTHGVVLTGTNADTANREIRELCKTYADENPDRAVLVESLGELRYLSAMKHADAVVGNSSSGLLEAPVMNVPTVNIGNRQAGRFKPSSVIDCEPQKEAITAAIGKSMDPIFRSMIPAMPLPMLKEDTAKNVIDVLVNHSLDRMTKSFFDISFDLP